MLLKSINYIYYYINLKLFVAILAFFFNKLIPKWVWLLSSAFEHWTQHKYDVSKISHLLVLCPIQYSNKLNENLFLLEQPLRSWNQVLKHNL